MTNVLERAADFLWRNARLLERAMFAYHFLNGPAEHVRHAVVAYRNSDGGFGHALEPDVRAQASQPLHVEVALRALQAAGVRDRALALDACDFLASVAGPQGSVPLVLPTILGHPRAAHWQELDPPDESPNPTAALVGLLLDQGVAHPWLDEATAWCWRRLAEPITEAHGLRCALTFLQFSPDRRRSNAMADKVAAMAPGARWFKAEPDSGSYGISPLQLVPAPDAAGRATFSDALLAVHLEHLLHTQEEDGGWPLTWTPPGPGAAQEWRGILTLEALVTLRAYGRIPGTARTQ